MRQYHKIVYTYMHVKMTALANSLNQKKSFIIIMLYIIIIILYIARSFSSSRPVAALLVHRTNSKIHFVIDIRQLDMA